MTIRKAIAFVLILMMSVAYTIPAFAADNTEEATAQPAVTEQAPAVDAEENAIDQTEESGEVSEPVADAKSSSGDRGVIASGRCGLDDEEDVFWTLTSDGKLTVSGTGLMACSYEQTQDMPWSGYSDMITSVEVADGMTDLGDGAFRNLTNLKNVSLPETIRLIPPELFADSGIEELELPDNVDLFNASALRNCFDFRSITLRSSNSKLKIENDVLFSKDGKILYYYPRYKGEGAYTIPDTVTELWSESFAQSKITSVVIPDSVKEVNDSTFSGCQYLQEATIGNGVRILNKTFEWCCDLENVTLGSKVRELNGTFYQCESLAHIELNHGLKRIGPQAFWGTAITRLEVPASVEWLDGDAFTPGEDVEIINLDPVDEDFVDEEDEEAAYKHGITGDFNLDMAFEILDRVNGERSSRGLAPLTMDVKLLNAAQIRAAEAAVYMVPSHKRPSGSPFNTVSPKAHGENLAVGQKSAASVMESWMNSEGHRSNILDSSYQSIGIACFKGTKGEYYFSQVFSRNTVEAEAPRQSGTEERTILSYFGAAYMLDFWIGELKGNDLYVGYGDIEGTPGSSHQLMVLSGSEEGGWQTCQALDANTFTWWSDNESIATVNRNGVATFRNNGTCTIVAYAGDIARAEININVSNKHTHHIVKVAKVAPTCQTKGVKAHYECTGCGKTFKDKAGKKPIAASKLAIKKVKHKYKKKVITDQFKKSSATCTKPASYYYACKMCGQKGKKKFKYGKKLGHVFQGERVVKATTTSNGSIVKYCTRCGKKSKKKTIYKASNIKLNRTSVQYMGGGQEKNAIAVTVKDKKKKTISSSNYTVTYSDPVYASGVGSGKVTVTFNDVNYTGSITLTYQITNCPAQ